MSAFAWGIFWLHFGTVKSGEEILRGTHTKVLREDIIFVVNKAHCQLLSNKKMIIRNILCLLVLSSSHSHQCHWGCKFKYLKGNHSKAPIIWHDLKQKSYASFRCGAILQITPAFTVISHSEAASDGWGCRRVKIHQAAYLKWQWCFEICMCVFVCVCLCCFLAWPSGPEVAAAALLFQSRDMVTLDHTHRRKRQEANKVMESRRKKNYIIVVFFCCLNFSWSFCLIDPALTQVCAFQPLSSQESVSHELISHRAHFNC